MKAKISLMVVAIYITHSCGQVLAAYFNIPYYISLSNKYSDSKSSHSRSCGVHQECVPRNLCASSEVFFAHRFTNDVCSHSEICCDIPSKKTEPPVPKEQNDDCGWHGSVIKPEINADTSNESHVSDFPWMVAVLRTEYIACEVIKLYDCSGSLIAPNVVLTASRCVIDRQANQLTVRGGEWNIKYSNEIINNVDRNVNEIITHKKYDKHYFYNDVALLVLNESFTWQKNIRPICLPALDTNFDYSGCYATSWSKEEIGFDGKYEHILKKISLPLIPRGSCQKYLRQTRLGMRFKLHESFLCAGGEHEKGTCRKDVGAPLVCPIHGVKDRYYMAGIVSWNVECRTENVPGVYVNIPYLRQWISEKLAARSAK